MERLVYFGFLIIFISMVFSLFMFENFSVVVSRCLDSGCSDSAVFFSLLFGFFIVGAFVMIDFFVGIVIIREKPWEKQTYKRHSTKNISGKIESLRKEYKDIENAKAEAEKRYYKGNFDTETFKRMLENYEQKMIEVKSKISSMKSRQKKSGAK